MLFLEQCLISLFRQTILPGHIVLYLSHEDFPKGKENITGYEFLLHRHDIRNTNYIINKFKENEEYKDLLNSVLEKYPERKYNLQYFVLDMNYLYDKGLR